MNFFSDVKEKKKNLKSKLKIVALILIPFISIMLVIMFRHTFMPKAENIVESVKNLKSYNSIVEYTIKNSRGEYTNKAHINYCKDEMKIDFGEDLTKIYKDDKIIMKYNKKGEVYEVGRDMDIVYPMAFLSEIFKSPITSISEGQEEWGDLKYIKIELNLEDMNKHLDRATLYINKKDKTPILIKMFDDKSNQRVNIEYREFSKKDVCKSKDS